MYASGPPGTAGPLGPPGGGGGAGCRRSPGAAGVAGPLGRRGGGAPGRLVPWGWRRRCPWASGAAGAPGPPGAAGPWPPGVSLADFFGQRGGGRRGILRRVDRASHGSPAERRRGLRRRRHGNKSIFGVFGFAGLPLADLVSVAYTWQNVAGSGGPFFNPPGGPSVLTPYVNVLVDFDPLGAHDVRCWCSSTTRSMGHHRGDRQLQQSRRAERAYVFVDPARRTASSSARRRAPFRQGVAAHVTVGAAWAERSYRWADLVANLPPCSSMPSPPTAACRQGAVMPSILLVSGTAATRNAAATNPFDARQRRAGLLREHARTSQHPGSMAKQKSHSRRQPSEIARATACGATAPRHEPMARSCSACISVTVSRWETRGGLTPWQRGAPAEAKRPSPRARFPGAAPAGDCSSRLPTAGPAAACPGPRAAIRRPLALPAPMSEPSAGAWPTRDRLGRRTTCNR